jgi:hypothetical protein
MGLFLLGNRILSDFNSKFNMKGGGKMEIYTAKKLEAGRYQAEVVGVKQVDSKFDSSPRLEVSFKIDGLDRPIRSWMNPDLGRETDLGKLVAAVGFDPSTYVTEPFDTYMLIGRRCDVVLEPVEQDGRSWIKVVNFFVIQTEHPVPSGAQGEVPF